MAKASHKAELNTQEIGKQTPLEWEECQSHTRVQPREEGSAGRKMQPVLFP